MVTDKDVVREALKEMYEYSTGSGEAEQAGQAIEALDRLVSRLAEAEDENERLERKVAVLADVAAKFNEHGELLEEALRNIRDYARTDPGYNSGTYALIAVKALAVGRVGEPGDT